MIPIKYEYTKTATVFKEMTNITEYWIIEILILIIWVAIIISLVFFVIPKISIFMMKSNKLKEKEKKKKLIDKIILQKNLEDLIRREIEGWKD